MKILKMTLENICGVERGEIYADCANVLISGQNGAGKSTYANAYSLLMTGKFYDGTSGEVNFQDANGNYIRDDKVHAVEIEFESGLTLRREFLNKFDKQKNFTGITQKFYADGVPLKQKDYDAKVNRLTQGAPINPFGFCKMNWKERRQILMSMIVVDDTEILKNFPKLELGKLDAQSFMDAKKNIIRHIEAELANIPARIDELNQQLIDGDISDLQQKVSAKSEEILKLQSGGKNTAQLKYSISQAEMRIKQEERQLEQEEQNFSELGKKYNEVKKSVPGKCPHCEQPMPLEKFQQTKNAELNKLKKQGWSAKDLISQRRKKLVEISKELEKLKAELSEVEKMPDNSAQVKQAMTERDELQSQLYRLQRSAENQKRIEELKQRETKLNVEVADLQRQINLAEKFQRQKIKTIEDAINAKFEVVKFKMFDRCINGAVKEICEPMIGGVTFDNLSKGEQLKASLDILKTMQDFYKVELPVWIDDAESYTSNSFVDLPNQIFYLKAVEGQNLKIEVEEKAKAVAA